MGDIRAYDLPCRWCGASFQQLRDAPSDEHGGGILEPVCNRCAATHPRCERCHELLLPGSPEPPEKVCWRCRAKEALVKDEHTHVVSLTSAVTVYCARCGLANPNPRIHAPGGDTYCRPCYARLFGVPLRMGDKETETRPGVKPPAVKEVMVALQEHRRCERCRKIPPANVVLVRVQRAPEDIQSLCPECAHEVQAAHPVAAATPKDRGSCADCGAANPNPRIEVPGGLVLCRPCYARRYPRPKAPGPEPAVRRASGGREDCAGCPKDGGAVRCEWSRLLRDSPTEDKPWRWVPGDNCPIGPGRTPAFSRAAPSAGILELVKDAACGEIARQTVALRARVRQLENTLGCMRAALDEYRKRATEAGRETGRLQLALANIRGIIGPNAPDPTLRGAAEGMAEEIREALRVVDAALEDKP